MPDENTTVLPDREASSLPKESVEPSSPAKVEMKENEPATSLKSPPPQKNISAPATSASHQESRVEPRIRVRWHADALIDGQEMYQGFVKDISLKGTDIFLDVNLQKVKSIRVRIHVPPLNKKSASHVMEVSGKVVYTAYDSAEFLFHTGVKFLQFNLESDLAFLQSRIALLNRPR